MSITWHYMDMGDYLTIRVDGVYRSGDISPAQIEEIAAQARTHRQWRVLIDLTIMQGSMPNTDRFILGEVAGKVWGRKLKVAVVAPAETISRFFENTAVNAGANVRAFDDANTAVEWLLHGGLAR